LKKFDDKNAIEALRQGDRQVFDALFRAYYEPLCNYANTMIGDMDEAEDVVQERFFKVWEKREELTINYSIKGFLIKNIAPRWG
jgi:RNA polymerase sigma-70 factor, ECF subfamily